MGGSAQAGRQWGGPPGTPAPTMLVLRFLSTRQKVWGVLSPLLGMTRQMSVTPSVLWPWGSAARRYVRKVRWCPGPPELRLAERLYGVVSRIL